MAFLEGRSLNNVTLYCVGNQSFGHLAIQFRGIRSKLIYKLNCFTFDKLTHLFKVKLISLVGKKGLQNGLLNLRERFKGIYLIRILFYKEGLYKINIDTRVSFYRNCSLFTGPRCLWGPVYGSRSLYVPPSNTFGWDFADVTLADDDTNSILTDDANRAIWSWWSSLRWCRSGKLVWRCPMWAMRSPRGSARWCKSCREYWSCDHVGDNVCWWSIG